MEQVSKQKNRARRIAAVLAVAFCLFLWAAAAFASPIRVNVNGSFMAFTEETDYPYIDMHSRVLIPLRGVLENAGATVDWDNKAKTATITKGDVKVRVPVGEKRILVNNEEKAIDTAAVIANGKISLPGRAVLEAIGFAVDWEPTEAIVYIINYDEWKAKWPDEDTAALANVKDVIKALQERNAGTRDTSFPSIRVVKTKTTEQLAKGKLAKGQTLLQVCVDVGNKTGKDVSLDHFYVKQGGKTFPLADGVSSGLIRPGETLKNNTSVVGWLGFVIAKDADYGLYYKQDGAVQRVQ